MAVHLNIDLAASGIKKKQWKGILDAGKLSIELDPAELAAQDAQADEDDDLSEMIDEMVRIERDRPAFERGKLPPVVYGRSFVAHVYGDGALSLELAAHDEAAGFFGDGVDLEVQADYTAKMTGNFPAQYFADITVREVLA